MRSKHFLGLGLVVGGFTVAALTATGCGGGGDDDNRGSGGAGGSSTTSTTTPTTSTATTAVATATSSGSGSGTTNHSFETATSIDINGATATQAALVDTGTKDYYKFTGQAGEKVVIAAYAQLLSETSNGFDPTIADTVVTLFDASMKQLAANDDMWPDDSTDAQLFTVLPADGDYYITVGDCHSAFGALCGTDSVGTLDYAVFIGDVDKLNFPEVVEGTEPNETEATSALVTYKQPGTTAGQYTIDIIDGSFQDATDIDAFSFTIPADTVVAPNQRAHANFWVQPILSDNGNGSTANTKVWVVDAANPAVHIAEADQTNYKDSHDATSGPLDLSVPVQPGKQYYLFAQRAAGVSTPPTDYYFILHFIGSHDPGPLEKSPDANDTPATAEVLTTPTGYRDGVYFVDGDISVAGTDVDHYLVDVPSGSTNAVLFCSAARAGSGLRDAKFSLLKSDGTPLSASSSLTEVANADKFLGGSSAVPIPAGQTKIVLKVEAASQDPNVSGTYYRCTLVLRT
jgi:hypothetical protein